MRYIYIYINGIFSDKMQVVTIAFSDEIGFVTDTPHNLLVFLFSNDLFLLLIVAFSNKTDFVTNSMTNNTFSDESVRHKKLKLLAMKKFVTIDQFGFAPTLSFGPLNSTQPIAMKSMFHR